MQGSRNRVVTALTAAVALAAGIAPAALVAMSSTAPAQDVTVLESAGTGDAGTLTIANAPAGSSGSVTYKNGASQQTQGLGLPTKGCTLVTQPTLLNLTGVLNGNAAPGGVGFDGNSIGVAEKAGSSGTSCAQVDSVGAETLTLQIGSALPAGTLMSGATLDLEFKQSATVTGTAFRTGNPTPVGTWDRVCNEGTADSGPDSKSGDNCTRYFGDPLGKVYFDKLVLSVKSGSGGAFALEGGADWPVDQQASHRSVITLVSVIDCNKSVSLPASGTAPKVTATRLDNADASACSPFLYTFTNSDQRADFVKPLTDQPEAQFLFEFDWTVDPANTSDPSKPLVKQTTADFDLDGGNAPVNLVWCPDLVPNSKGILVVDKVKDNQAAPDQAPGFPAPVNTKQFACIVSQQATLVSGSPSTTNDDKVLVHELIYVYGDIALRK